MCGLISEPELRPGLSPVNFSSAPGALTTRGRPNKGPADVYPLLKPQELPHPGLAEGLEQLARLQQRPLPPRGQPHQGGLAEVCLVSALEAALEKAPQTRNFLEEELPRVSISCQAGFEPGGVHDDARVRPQQVGLAEGLPRRVRNLLGPRSSAAFTAASGKLQPSA